MSDRKSKQPTQVLFERCRNMSVRQHPIKVNISENLQESFASPTRKLGFRRTKLERIKSLSFERRQFLSPKIVRATHDFNISQDQLTQYINKTVSTPSLIGLKQKRMIDPNILLDKPVIKKQFSPLIKKHKLFIMNLPLVV